VASLAAITVNAARSSYGSHVYNSSSSTGNITGIIGGSVVNGYSAGTGYTTSIVGVTGNNTTSIFSVSTGNTTGNGISIYEPQSANIVGGRVVNGYNAGPGYTASIVGVNTGNTTRLYEIKVPGSVSSSTVNIYSAGIGSNIDTATNSSSGSGNKT